jgi:hypothetical protein
VVIRIPIPSIAHGRYFMPCSHLSR